MGLTWVQRSLVFGLALIAVVTYGPDVGGSLVARATRDALILIIGPVGLAVAHGRNLGWRIDWPAVKHALALAAIVLPFYIVGSSLPTIRAYYPMWETSSALGEFLPHTLLQLVVVVAAETYYRGLLCVGVKDLGYKAVLISPVVYAARHTGKPPIELLLSGPTDVLFGVFDYRSDSLLPSVVAHGGGFILLDWLTLHPPLFPPGRVVAALEWVPVAL